MYQFLAILVMIYMPLFTSAQVHTPTRYKDVVFENVLVKKNLAYAATVKDHKKSAHLFDFYQPENDTIKKRPLVIWLHGGGFKFGKKTSRAIPLWSKMFAQRGYACAAINYRLTSKKALSKFPALADGCFDAIEDLYVAIAYFKQHSQQYNIDTNRIIVGGNSAGAITALQAVYANLQSIAKIAGRPDAATVSKEYNPQKIAGVINMWGAIFNPDWMQHATVPVVSVHGSKDRVVAFKSSNQLMYGSYFIHQQADSLGIPNKLKVYEGFGHELQKHFIPFYAGGTVKKKWREAGEFAAEFLYEEVIKKR